MSDIQVTKTTALGSIQSVSELTAGSFNGVNVRSVDIAIDTSQSPLSIAILNAGVTVSTNICYLTAPVNAVFASPVQVLSGNSLSIVFPAGSGNAIVNINGDTF